MQQQKQHQLQLTTTTKQNNIYYKNKEKAATVLIICIRECWNFIRAESRVLAPCIIKKLHVDDVLTTNIIF